MRIGNHTFEKISRFVIKRWKWIAVAVVAILILVFGILFVANLSNDAVAPDVAPEIVMTEPEYKTSVRERFGTENKDSAIILQATSESWVKIEDARGNTVFSRVLVPGDVYFVPNGDGYRGTFGNVGGVDVWVNGNLIAKLGELNARKSGIIMSPEGLTTP